MDRSYIDRVFDDLSRLHKEAATTEEKTAIGYTRAAFMAAHNIEDLDWKRSLKTWTYWVNNPARAS